MGKPNPSLLDRLQTMIKDMQSLHDTDYILVTEPINYLNYIHCQHIYLYAININTLEHVDGVMAVECDAEADPECILCIHRYSQHQSNDSDYVCGSCGTALSAPHNTTQSILDCVAFYLFTRVVTDHSTRGGVGLVLITNNYSTLLNMYSTRVSVTVKNTIICARLRVANYQLGFFQL